MNTSPVEAEEKKEGEYDEYKLQNSANTLIEAEEIKADPKLMEALKPYLEKKAKAYSSIAQLKNLGAKKKLEEVSSKLQK